MTEVEYKLGNKTMTVGYDSLGITKITRECLESLIEKQIPKKPDIEGDGYSDGELVYDTWICPNCRAYYEIGYDHYKHCPECGQKIDLSEVQNDRED